MNKLISDHEDEKVDELIGKSAKRESRKDKCNRME